MFDADRPIVSAGQDKLGRSTFAKSLARSILDHKNPDSLVIGLFGGWGSGKTSLINLTLEELRFATNNMADNEIPIILNFSPWSYSEQGQLVYSFFRRLSSELRQASYLDNAEQIIYLLELYISFFTHQPIPKPLRLKHRLSTKILKWQTVKNEAYGWESGRDLTQVKKELNDLLRAQKHKIIIIMDNISRIADDEVNQIFQIVKSMGDFANTVYVLAIDKEHAIQAMSRVHHGSGEQYLQKLIQLPFEIPPIEKQDIETLLLIRLDVITTYIPQVRWDRNYWANIYYSALKYFFKNYRDVTHYINTLGFSFSFVKDVVNPVDFFAITALELFSPALHSGIRNNKDLFTDLMDNVYEPTPEKLAEDKLRCEEILSREKHIPSTIIKKLLMDLFPRLRNLYNPDIPFHHSEALARKNFRICNADMFDAYFRFSISSTTLSKEEFNAIFSFIKDEQGFALALLRLNRDGRITNFLDLLDGEVIYSVKFDYINHIINALMDSADMFPEEENSTLIFNTPMRIHRIIHQLLRRFDTAEKRFQIFSEAIKKSVNSLYSIIHELNLQSEEHDLAEDEILPEELRDFTPDQLYSLKQLAVEKIIDWANTQRLITHPQLIAILTAWEAWGNEEQCKAYVTEVTKDDKGLIAFLCAVFAKPIDQAIKKLAKSPAWHKHLEEIENFISIKSIELHVKKLFEDLSFETLREREQLAILIFLDLAGTETTKIIPKTTV